MKKKLLYGLDALCQMGVQVERWIPKAQVNGYNTDIRLLIINGKLQHQVLLIKIQPKCKWVWL